jgi:hypothetical protein
VKSPREKGGKGSGIIRMVLRCADPFIAEPMDHPAAWLLGLGDPLAGPVGKIEFGDH